MSMRRAFASIDLDALEHNVKGIRSKIDEDTKFMAVIKANGYGHGAVPLAKALVDMDTDWFAVATVDEAVELRNNGITKPILILGHTCYNQYMDLINYNLTPTIFSYETAKKLNALAAQMNTVVNVHVKVDTGMSRIGFKPTEEGIIAIIMMSTLQNVNVQGIFTHFACADGLDEGPTKAQFEKFSMVVNRLEECGLNIPLKHCANSAGIMRYPQTHMNMVRAGIILYGLYPSEEVDKSLLSLKPVMSLKAHVTFIKELEAGIPVSYGATFVTSRPTRVATVSIGYGDGYPRALSNQGRVLIKSQSVPIIGRICMDQLMVDITDAEHIHEGDEVTLIGKDGSEYISVEEASGMAGSFNYEFVCNVGRRVPRLYYKDGQVVDEMNQLR